MGGVFSLRSEYVASHFASPYWNNVAPCSPSSSPQVYDPRHVYDQLLRFIVNLPNGIHETNEQNLLMSAAVKFVKLHTMHLYLLFDSAKMLGFLIHVTIFCYCTYGLWHRKLHDWL